MIVPLRKLRRNLAVEAHGDGLSVAERDDATRLRKEVRILRMEKEIVKKPGSTLPRK